MLGRTAVFPIPDYVPDRFPDYAPYRFPEYYPDGFPDRLPTRNRFPSRPVLSYQETAPSILVNLMASQLPTFPSHSHPAVNKREYFDTPSLGTREDPQKFSA